MKVLQRSAGALLAAVALTAGVASGPAQAGELPSEPIVAAGGRLTVSGDVSATMSCAQSNAPNAAVCTADTGFFNYTDYEYSALRLFRVDLTANLKATSRIAILTEVRSENAGSPRPYGLYVRFKPWLKHDFDLQVGRVPPTFGAFARRSYASDNLLIGYPLAYQYLTSLRADALPANADELLRMRGRGWLSQFSVGNPVAAPGMPLVSAFHWDTGIQAHAATSWAELSASVTTGTVGDPLARDDNSGKNLAARGVLHPVTGLIIGASAAHGPFVTSQTTAVAGIPSANSRLTQTAWGADVEFSRGYYLLRAEGVLSSWTVPQFSAPFITAPLKSGAISVEGRYKIRPGLYAAARYDHLGFSEITGTDRTTGWDAPVTRTEFGGGYLLQRNLQLKLSYQHNSREGGRVVNLEATQLVFWF
ncbi:MAG TPA: hypothetical protein VHZ73_13530 [Vicinamibacterales bacterium]|jgi:hypothetical protein|nr:hypothetical protein [Vicinamibacterales bacterium]